MLNSVLGLLVICILSITNIVEPVGTYEECFTFKSNIDKFGFQLGGFIVVSDKGNIEHEYGHYIQEQMLGMLYIPIIGGTSLYGNARSYIEIKQGKTLTNYHLLWSEKQANILGEEK